MIRSNGHHRQDVTSLLPALPDELERVRLDLELAKRQHVIDDIRCQITAEEAAQNQLQQQVDARIGELRRDDERLTAEVTRLEQRLERLAFSRRALSDMELDSEDQAERAEEAAFWAEWRQQREQREQQQRRETVFHRPRGDQDITLRQLYLALARLIHPDLARDHTDKLRREAVMRLANAARDAKDVEQLRRLLLIWSKPDAGAYVRDLTALRARLAERDVERGELARQLRALETGTIGVLRRRPRAELERYIKREEERLRREVATLRLRRRRLLSALEERRREMMAASD